MNWTSPRRYATEKSLKDHGEKVSGDDRLAISLLRAFGSQRRLKVG